MAVDVTVSSPGFRGDDAGRISPIPRENRHWWPDVPTWLESEKKTGVVEYPQVFDHAGLLVNEPPGQAGLPFI